MKPTETYVGQVKCTIIQIPDGLDEYGEHFQVGDEIICDEIKYEHMGSEYVEYRWTHDPAYYFMPTEVDVIRDV